MDIRGKRGRKKRQEEEIFLRRRKEDSQEPPLYIRHGWYVNRIKVDAENMLGAKYRLSQQRGEPTNRPASLRNLYFMFLWSHRTIDSVYLPFCLEKLLRCSRSARSTSTRREINAYADKRMSSSEVWTLPL